MVYLCYFLPHALRSSQTHLGRPDEGTASGAQPRHSGMIADRASPMTWPRISTSGYVGETLYRGYTHVFSTHIAT